MSEHKTQGNDLIFALDIGTRSVIGVVGKAEGDRFKVLDVETAEHKKRAMLDGQIDNIRQVAEKLKKEGLIDSSLVLIAQKYFYGSSLKAGSYRLNSNMTGKMILDVLSGAAVDTEEAS